MPRAVVSFECQTQGCNAALQEELFVSEPNYMAERMSDGDVCEYHDVACESCGADYEVFTANGMAGIWATVDNNNVNIELQHDPEFDDYEDFLLHYQPANNTVGAYEKASEELLELIAINGSNPTSILNRMVYSQFIAAMEAYLSDKILLLATDHPEIKDRITKNAGFLKDQRLTLTEVLLDPSKAENLFRVGLQKILYHDLGKVETLYNIALDGPFFPVDQSVKPALENAVQIRHDCVHRNGADINGTFHQFDEITIKALADKVATLIQHIENQAEKSIEALI